MGGRKKLLLKFSERCKNIMYSNWRGQLFTVSLDATEERCSSAMFINDDVYSTNVMFTMKAGNPCLWVQEDDRTNMNYVFDNRASFSVTTPFPGPLAALLQSQDKTPSRVALSGEIVLYPEEKVPSLRESLQNDISSVQNNIKTFSLSASTLLNSSNYAVSILNLKPLLDPSKVYNAYNFSIRTISFVESSGGIHDVSADDLKERKGAEYDWIPQFAAKMIDAINLSEQSRRALSFLCYTHLDVIAKDAFALSVDRKGMDILALARGEVGKEGRWEYNWVEVRLSFNEEAYDVNTFCSLLANMEREAIHEIRVASGLFKS